MFVSLRFVLAHRSVLEAGREEAKGLLHSSSLLFSIGSCPASPNRASFLHSIDYRMSRTSAGWSEAELLSMAFRRKQREAKELEQEQSRQRTSTRGIKKAYSRPRNSKSASPSPRLHSSPLSPPFGRSLSPSPPPTPHQPLSRNGIKASGPPPRHARSPSPHRHAHRDRHGHFENDGERARKSRRHRLDSQDRSKSRSQSREGTRRKRKKRSRRRSKSQNRESRQKIARGTHDRDATDRERCSARSPGRESDLPPRDRSGDGLAGSRSTRQRHDKGALDLSPGTSTRQQSNAAGSEDAVDEFGRTVSGRRSRPSPSPGPDKEGGRRGRIRSRSRNDNPSRRHATKRRSSRSLSPSRSRSPRSSRPGSKRSTSPTQDWDRRRERSRARGASPGPDKVPQWSRDKFAEVAEEEEGENGRPERVVPRDYVPPLPTWKSKAGGVYIPIIRK